MTGTMNKQKMALYTLAMKRYKSLMSRRDAIEILEEMIDQYPKYKNFYESHRKETEDARNYEDSIGCLNCDASI